MTIMLFATALTAALPPPADFAQAVRQIEARIEPPAIPDREVNLFDLTELRPDSAGTHDFRHLVQKAIDDLAAAGGGTLLLPHPAGRFTWSKPKAIYRFSGGIELRTGVKLALEPAIVLRFDCKPENYTRDGAGVLTRYEGTTIYGHAPLIRAFGVEDIALVATPGHGAMPEITGAGEAWLRWQETQLPPGESTGIREANNAGIPLRERRSEYPGIYFRRPVMLQFFLCRRALVDGIKLTDAPFWMVHPVFSESVTLRNLLFDGPNVNNDAIDIDSSRFVLVENVMFNNHDDNIALKAGRDREGREGVDVAGTELENWPGHSPCLVEGRLGGPTEDVVIRNNVFKGHYAIAVGSEMSGGVRRVYALHNHSVQSVANVLFVKSSRRRGGIVEDLFIHDFEAVAVRGSAVSLIPNYDGDLTSPHPPTFRRIHISQLRVGSAGAALAAHGWADAPIEDVSITDARIGLSGAGKIDAVAFSGVIDLHLENFVVDGRRHDGDFTLPTEKTPPRQN